MLRILGYSLDLVGSLTCLAILETAIQKAVSCIQVSSTVPSDSNAHAGWYRSRKELISLLLQPFSIFWMLPVLRELPPLANSATKPPLQILYTILFAITITSFCYTCLAISLAQNIPQSRQFLV